MVPELFVAESVSGSVFVYIKLIFRVKAKLCIQVYLILYCVVSLLCLAYFASKTNSTAKKLFFPPLLLAIEVLQRR